MTRAAKTLARMEQNPRGWRYEQVASVLRAFDFTLRSRSGSHRVWSHPGTLPVTVVEKGHGTVPAYQVEQVTAAIRRTQEGE